MVLYDYLALNLPRKITFLKINKNTEIKVQRPIHRPVGDTPLTESDVLDCRFEVLLHSSRDFSVISWSCLLWATCPVFISKSSTGYLFLQIFPHCCSLYIVMILSFLLSDELCFCQSGFWSCCMPLALAARNSSACCF